MWRSGRSRRHRDEVDRLLAEFEADSSWTDRTWQPVEVTGVGTTRRRKVHPAVAGLVVVLCLMLPAYLFNASNDKTPGGDPGNHAFLMTQPGSGAPVSYDPCRPVTYAVNPDGANPDEVTMVRRATDRVAAASGFTLAYVGATASRPFARESSPDAAVIIGFASPEERPDLAGDTAGEGGSSALVVANTFRYTHGSIALDRELFGSLLSQSGGPAAAEAIVMHEWGHVLGLDHVDDPHQLMYADNIGQNTWGAGDLTGLRALAATHCS